MIAPQPDEPADMPQISCNGVSLNLIERGEGSETIVFSHGLLWDWQMWEPQLAHFQSRYRCLAYDHRGQAGSGGGPRQLDLDQLADDAIALIESQGNPPCHFVGLSMGGMVGMRVAARRPELLRSLCLLDTSAEPEPAQRLRRLRWLVRLLTLLGPKPLINQALKEMFGPTYLNNPNNAADLARWRQQIGALPRFARHAVRGVIERGNVLNELGKIRCPVLVLVGEEDQTTPATCAEKIAERIADARLISLPKVGHMSSLEAPRQINAVIDSFLSTVQHDARDAIAELTEI